MSMHINYEQNGSIDIALSKIVINLIEGTQLSLSWECKWLLPFFILFAEINHLQNHWLLNRYQGCVDLPNCPIKESISETSVATSVATGILAPFSL